MPVNQNSMCFSATELQQLKNRVTIAHKAATRENPAEKLFSVSTLIPLAKSLMQRQVGTEEKLIQVVET